MYLLVLQNKAVICVILQFNSVKIILRYLVVVQE